jgi:AhpD family alkylhydroperoxidase
MSIINLSQELNGNREKSHPEHYDRLLDLMNRLGERIPLTMAAFGQLHRETVVDGALSKKVKELIALGIAVSVRCDGCMPTYVHDALKAGASRQEIAETIGVAIMMGGGPSVMYGCEALEALEQFEAGK